MSIGCRSISNSWMTIIKLQVIDNKELEERIWTRLMIDRILSDESAIKRLERWDEVVMGKVEPPTEKEVDGYMDRIE